MTLRRRKTTAGGENQREDATGGSKYPQDFEDLGPFGVPKSLDDQKTVASRYFIRSETFRSVGLLEEAFREAMFALAFSHPRALSLKDDILSEMGDREERNPKLRSMVQEWLQEAEKLENAPIVYIAAMCLRQGYGCTAQSRLHMELMEEAMRMGLAAAYLGVGFGLDNELAGPTYERDISKIFSCYRSGLRRGNALCANNLGVFFSEPGVGIHIDQGQALEYYLRAALMGDPQACANMACNIIHAKFPQWYLYVNDAIKYATVAAESGSLSGLRRLGECYLVSGAKHGLGVPASALEAMYWFYKAAEKARKLGDSYELAVCEEHLQHAGEVPPGWQEVIQLRLKADEEEERRLRRIRAMPLLSRVTEDAPSVSVDERGEEHWSRSEKGDGDQDDMRTESRTSTSDRATKTEKDELGHFSKVLIRTRVEEELRRDSTEEPYVYLCFSQDDRREASLVRDFLEGYGIRTKIVEDFLVPGEGLFREQVFRGALRAKAFVLLLSDRTFDSEECLSHVKGYRGLVSRGEREEKAMKRVVIGPVTQTLPASWKPYLLPPELQQEYVKRVEERRLEKKRKREEERQHRREQKAKEAQEHSDEDEEDESEGEEEERGYFVRRRGPAYRHTQSDRMRDSRRSIEERNGSQTERQQREATVDEEEQEMKKRIEELRSLDLRHEVSWLLGTMAVKGEKIQNFQEKTSKLQSLATEYMANGFQRKKELSLLQQSVLAAQKEAEGKTMTDVGTIMEPPYWYRFLSCSIL